MALQGRALLAQGKERLSTENRTPIPRYKGPTTHVSVGGCEPLLSEVNALHRYCQFGLDV
jgi:hypothetical protein